MTTAVVEPVATKLAFGDDDEGTAVEPTMSVSGGPGGILHAPIHESLTLSALINVPNSGVAPGTSLSSANNADWEFIRGVVWNDDPAGLLFDDEADVNHAYSAVSMVDKVQRRREGVEPVPARR